MTMPDHAIADALFDCTFELAPIGMALLAADQRPLRVNRVACEMLGYTAEELLAMPPQALSLAQDRDEESKLRGQLLAGTEASYTRVKAYLHRDGRVVWARVHCGMVRDDHGAPLHFVVQMELLSGPERAADSEAGWPACQRHLREQAVLLDHTRDAVVLHDPDQRIASWNRGAERMFGYARHDAIGRRFEDLMGPAAVLPPDAHRQLADGGEWVGVLECIDARGRAVTVERRCSLMKAGDVPVRLVLSVDTDITEQRRAEKEIVLLNNLLEQRIRSRTAQLQESNDDLRGLAYSLAHDLRAPLSSVDVFSAQLEGRLADRLDEKSRHYLRRVRAGVRQMSELTDGLLALANLSSAPLLHHSVDLSALAQSVVERLRERDPARQVIVAIEETPRAQGDVRLLTDLMENLVGNAWKFTSRTPGARIEFSGEWGPGGTYRYCVRDNGAGFDPAYAYKLFNPFQRLHTAEEFEGTGIGLAMVRKIVSRHHGSIWAESRPGAGAAFRFTLGDRGGVPAGPTQP